MIGRPGGYSMSLWIFGEHIKVSYLRSACLNKLQFTLGNDAIFHNAMFYFFFTIKGNSYTCAVALTVCLAHLIPLDTFIHP